MGDIITSLKRVAAEHDMMVFLGGFVAVMVGLAFNGIGIGSSHWIEIEAGSQSTHCGPFGDDSDTDILDHFCGFDNEAFFLMPAGNIVTVIGQVVLYFFFRQGLNRAVLLRVGGALVFLGGLLVIIGDGVWGSDVPVSESVSLGYSFAISVTGGVLMLLAGCVQLGLSVLKDYASPYSNV